MYAKFFTNQLFLCLNVKKVCKTDAFEVSHSPQKIVISVLNECLFLLRKMLYGSKLWRSITGGSSSALMRAIILSRYSWISLRRRL